MRLRSFKRMIGTAVTIVLVVVLAGPVLAEGETDELFYYRIFRLSKYIFQCYFVKSMKWRYHRHSSYKLRD